MSASLMPGQQQSGSNEPRDDILFSIGNPGICEDRLAAPRKSQNVGAGFSPDPWVIVMRHETVLEM